MFANNVRLGSGNLKVAFTVLDTAGQKRAPKHQEDIGKNGAQHLRIMTKRMSPQGSTCHNAQMFAQYEARLQRFIIIGKNCEECVLTLKERSNADNYLNSIAKARVQ